MQNVVEYFCRNIKIITFVRVPQNKFPDFDVLSIEKNRFYFRKLL